MDLLEDIQVSEFNLNYDKGEEEMTGFKFPKNWEELNITAGDVWGWEEDGTFVLLREMGGEERFSPEELIEPRVLA